MAAVLEPQTEDSLKTFGKVEIARLLGISECSLMRRVADGSFPKPLPLGSRLRWSAAVVKAWLAANGLSQKRQTGRK